MEVSISKTPDPKGKSKKQIKTFHQKVAKNQGTRTGVPRSRTCSLTVFIVFSRDSWSMNSKMKNAKKVGARRSFHP